MSTNFSALRNELQSVMLQLGREIPEAMGGFAASRINFIDHTHARAKGAALVLLVQRREQLGGGVRQHPLLNNCVDGPHQLY